VHKFRLSRRSVESTLRGLDASPANNCAPTRLWVLFRCLVFRPEPRANDSYAVLAVRGRPVGLASAAWSNSVSAAGAVMVRTAAGRMAAAELYRFRARPGLPWGMGAAPRTRDLPDLPGTCPLCHQVHKMCVFTAGSLYCIRPGCRNPRLRELPPGASPRAHPLPAATSLAYGACCKHDDQGLPGIFRSK
jgi:hypothetical protein